MTYAKDGEINYRHMDPFKKEAQAAGLETSANIERLGLKDVLWSRGESVHLTEADDFYIADLVEGLGTKNKVAEAFRILMQVLSVLTGNPGQMYFDQIAQCTVAMIVNDMITLGALPFSVCMHHAVGTSEWFKDKARGTALIQGWKRACNLARTVYGGGETPTLPSIIYPDTVVLGGSGTGIIRPKGRLIQGNIQAGDSIIIVQSGGIGANGLSLARSIAETVKHGYLAQLSDGRYFGEALLDPTIILVSLIEECLNAGVLIHYSVHITGHGWRKLMRSVHEFRYVIETLPPALPVFDFIAENGPVTTKEMYETFNMNGQFALYVPKSEVAAVLKIAQSLGFKAFEAGYIEEGRREVFIEPLELTLDDLDVR